MGFARVYLTSEMCHINNSNKNKQKLMLIEYRLLMLNLNYFVLIYSFNNGKLSGISLLLYYLFLQKN